MEDLLEYVSTRCDDPLRDIARATTLAALNSRDGGADFVHVKGAVSAFAVDEGWLPLPVKREFAIIRDMMEGIGGARPPSPRRPAGSTPWFTLKSANIFRALIVGIVALEAACFFGFGWH